MRHFFMAATLPLMGCLAGAGNSAADQPAGGICAAADLQYLIGMPESALSEMNLPSPLRVIHPNQPVTMDLSPSRLNIEIDANGMIKEVRCG